MTRLVVGLVLALSTAACAARGATPSVAGPQGAAWGEADRVAVLRQYVGHLPIGGRVRVQTVDGQRWSATLLSADHERVVLQPRGRLAEPAQAIPLSALQLIEPERPGGNNQLLKAVGIGVATGAATFFAMLMIAFATID